MGKVIIFTIIVTILAVLFFIFILSAVYQAGRESMEKEYRIKQAALEDTIRDYQDKLAQVRVERKLYKKGGDSPR